MFDDDLGRVVSLTGAFVLNTDNLDVCSGAIPLGASFDAGSRWLRGRRRGERLLDERRLSCRKAVHNRLHRLSRR
jgi:hypothetical protein